MSTAAAPRPSPTTSSSFNFPRSSSPTKDTLKPNAHPYAIKTTSTALLSRSSSSPQHSLHHHYVPSSPNPSSPQKKHEPRPSGHRYSRSLTSDLPRPLPVPPSASPSPTNEYFERVQQGESQDDTPTRRPRRAETLPGTVTTPVSPDLNLPEDPRRWTPSQLSSYLTSTLRMTNGDLPALVAKDIASFVREKRISGRVFLRLNEGDLEEYGINHLWCTTLLTSSRNLRSNALQDRIWGFGNSPQESLPSTRQRTLSNASDNSDSSNISSSSASSFTDRGRNATSNGKVRGMVASFERSSSIDEGSHSRSVSPNKRISTSGTASPTKARSRPGSAIFPSNTGVLPSYTGRNGYPGNISPTYTGNFNASSNTRRDSAASNSNSSPPRGDYRDIDPPIFSSASGAIKEPRLLPLPPDVFSSQNTGGFTPQATGDFTPQATGTGPFAGIFAPQPAYGVFDPTAAPFDPTATPLNPNATPFDPQFIATSPFDSSSGVHVNQRPLPLPPHQGQYYQPHLVSPGGSGGDVMYSVSPTQVGAEEMGHESAAASGYESTSVSGYDTARDTGADTETEQGSVSGYDTALEDTHSIPTFTADPLPTPRMFVPAEDEEELSMEALLAAQPTDAVNGVGAEAWELELGETVKRVGRVTGRTKARTRAKAKGKNSVRGVEGLFEPDPNTAVEENREAKPKTQDREISDAELLDLVGGAATSSNEQESASLTAEEEERERQAKEAKRIAEWEHARDIALEEERVREIARVVALKQEEERVKRVEEERVALEARELAATEAREQAKREADQADRDAREAALEAQELALTSSINETRKVAEALRVRVEEVDKRVHEMEVQIQQDRERKAIEDAERERAERERKQSAEWATTLDPREILRRVLAGVVVPVLGSRTPSVLTAFLATSPSASTTNSAPRDHRYRTWRRQTYSPTNGGYLMLVGIGVCAVVLKVLAKRALNVGVARRVGRG